MNSERKTRVEQHAYKLWEKEGRPHGRDKDHWHQAERDLAEEDERNGAAGSSETRGASEAEAKPDVTVRTRRKGGASSVEATPDAAAKPKRRTAAAKEAKPAKSASAKTPAAAKEPKPARAKPSPRAKA
jgi:hypothetical protein